MYDEKSVNGTVDEVLLAQRVGRAVPQVADHPWKVMARAAANLAEAERVAHERAAPSKTGD